MARKASALRGFVRFLRREGLLDARSGGATVVAPRRDHTLPAHLTEQDMLRLLEMPDVATPLGRRDRAILELFYASGLRLSELESLDLENVDLAGRRVRVMGKGRKERIVPFNQACEQALRAWMKDRAAILGRRRHAAATPPVPAARPRAGQRTSRALTARAGAPTGGPPAIRCSSTSAARV